MCGKATATTHSSRNERVLVITLTSRARWVGLFLAHAHINKAPVLSGGCNDREYTGSLPNALHIIAYSALAIYRATGKAESLNTSILKESHCMVYKALSEESYSPPEFFTHQNSTVNIRSYNPLHLLSYNCCFIDMFCISLWNSLPSDSDVTGSPTLASFKYYFIFLSLEVLY